MVWDSRIRDRSSIRDANLKLTVLYRDGLQTKCLSSRILFVNDALDLDAYVIDAVGHDVVPDCRIVATTAPMPMLNRSLGSAKADLGKVCWRPLDHEILIVDLHTYCAVWLQHQLVDVKGAFSLCLSP